MAVTRLLGDAVAMGHSAAALSDAGREAAAESCPRRWMRSALHPPRIGVENLEFEAAGTDDQLAAGRHAAGERDDEAADRVDILGALLIGEVDARAPP